MTRAEALKHNRIRKLILESLAPEYPRTVDTVILRGCMANLGYPMDSDDMASYLAYLQERGYVRIDEKKGFGITMVKITADGLDVLDERVEDKGVGVHD